MRGVAQELSYIKSKTMQAVKNFDHFLVEILNLFLFFTFLFSTLFTELNIIGNSVLV